MSRGSLPLRGRIEPAEACSKSSGYEHIHAMKRTLELPQEVAALATADGKPLDTAVAEAVVWDAYRRGKVSAGRAASLLHLTRLGFEEARVERGISRPTAEAELGQAQDERLPSD
jgi:predicted HTH domain antitoxin